MFPSYLLLSASLALASGTPGTPPPSAEEPAAEEPAAEEPAAQEAEAEPVADEGPPGRPQPGGPHYDLELLYAAGLHDQVLALAQRRAEADPTDVEITWHVARAIFEIAEAVEVGDTSVDKLALYKSMRDWSERGLALDPDHPHLRFARGLANARIGTTRGVLSPLFLARGVEDDWRYVIESDFVYSSLDRNEMLPCDAWLTLGIFHRLLPEWWIVYAITGSQGNLEVSESFLLRADGCGPDRIGTLKELGVTRLCVGTRYKSDRMLAEGRKTLERVLALEPQGRTDEIDLRHAARLIEDPSLACTYSRDGQQKLDRSSLPPKTGGDP